MNVSHPTVDSAAYIHDLSVNNWEPADSPDTDKALSIRPGSDWNKRSICFLLVWRIWPSITGCV